MNNANLLWACDLVAHFFFNLCFHIAADSVYCK